MKLIRSPSSRKLAQGCSLQMAGIGRETTDKACSDGGGWIPHNGSSFQIYLIDVLFKVG